MGSFDIVVAWPADVSWLTLTSSSRISLLISAKAAVTTLSNSITKLVLMAFKY